MFTTIYFHNFTINNYNIDNTELLLLVMLIILIKAVDYTMCEYNIRLKVILFSGDEVILIAYYFQEITMTKYMTEKYYSNHKFQDNAGSFSNVLTRAVSN